MLSRQSNEENKMFAFFQMQGFGDLVILCNVLKKYTINNDDNFIIMGSYLNKLYNELGLDIKTITFQFDGNDIPPIYNLRNNGIKKGFFNGLEIRNLLLNNYKNKQFLLIFDNEQVNYCGIRERFFTFNLPSIFIEAKENVYLTYTNFLKDKNNFRYNYENYFSLAKNRNLSIFPSSRQKRKIITDDILTILIQKSRSIGLKPTIYNIGNDDTYSQKIKNYVKILPKTFKSVIETVKNSSFVISSDSVTAHIAEFYNKPIYVISPKQNNYWLPLSSYDKNFWSEFKFIKKDPNHLDHFFKLRN